MAHRGSARPSHIRAMPATNSAMLVRPGMYQPNVRPPANPMAMPATVRPVVSQIDPRSAFTCIDTARRSRACRQSSSPIQASRLSQKIAMVITILLFRMKNFDDTGAGRPARRYQATNDRDRKPGHTQQEHDRRREDVEGGGWERVADRLTEKLQRTVVEEDAGRHADQAADR